MERRIEDSQRMIDALAGKVLKRLRAAGARSVQMEDIRSELTVSWCIARNKFDPERGASFATYLWQTMLNNINRWAKAQIEEAGCFEFDAPAPGGNDDDGLDRHEAVATADAGPHEIAEAASVRRLVMRNLPDTARRVVELLEEPSDEILEVLHAFQARTAYARSRGVTASPAPTAITASMVFDALGLTRTERHNVNADLNFWAQR